jgi:hypothetical protein
MFLHASFADYLNNPDRSKDFHVGSRENLEETVTLNLLEIWNRCSGDDIATGMYDLLVFIIIIDLVLVKASVESTWQQYCSKLDDKMPLKDVTKFYARLFRGLVLFLGRVAYGVLEKPIEPLTYVQLQKIHMGKLCYYFDSLNLFDFVRNLVNYLLNSQLQS